MRVLMTADPVGGVWTYAIELVEALAELDVSTTLAVMGGTLSEGQRRQAEASVVAGVHESDFAVEWMDDPEDDLARAGNWLLDLADDVRPDVVHLNGYAHAGLGWPAPTVVVGHSDVASWWAAVHGEAPPPAWDAYRRRVGAGLAAADEVVTPTAAFRSELQRWYALEGGRVIPNARRDGWVVRAAKEPFVLAAGRLWDEAKNLGALDAVAGRIDWPVVLAGDPRTPSGSIRAVRHARAAGVLGFDRLVPLLARAAVFAHPARYEPFGLAPLEAALSGCALVLGDIPTLREVWGDAAVYVHPDDEEALAATLDGILSAPARAGEMGARARQRARAYRPAAMGAAYVDTYRSLCRAPAGRR